MKDIISRLKRIKAINTMKTELKNSSLNIIFSREKKMKTTSNIDFDIYTNDKILSIINKSLIDAKYTAESILGMKINKENIINKPQLFSHSKNIKENHINYNNEAQTSDEELLNSDSNSLTQTCIVNSSDELEREIAKYFDNILILENCGMGLNSKDFSIQFVNDQEDNVPGYVAVPTNSQFVKVTLKNKKSLVIKKLSLCWLLKQPRDRVSIDRLRRFIHNEQIALL